MSGTDRPRWPDDLKRALERRVLDEGASVAQAHREAVAGELRAETGGPKLPAYDIPESSARYIVTQERKARDKLLEAQGPVVAQDEQIRQMQAMTLALLKAELLRLQRHIRAGTVLKNPRWTDITAAAKAVKQAADMTPAPKAATVQTSDGNGTNPSEGPGFIASLAKQNPSQGATAQAKRSAASVATHVQAEPTTQGAAGPVAASARAASETEAA